MAPTEEQPGARPPIEGRFEPGADTDLRSRTARGTMVNGAFHVGVSALGLVKGVAVAGILSTTDYGIWGLLLAALTTLIMLGSVGIDDKYIQQDDPDQKRAFEIAFTLQCALAAVFVLVILAGMPLFALLYGEPDMILPGMAFAVVMPALALYMPLWAHYRRMDFVRQRTLGMIDPVVSLVVTLALAFAGLGVWALVIGAIAGAWVAAFFIVRSSPYELHLRWDRAAVREYTSFSWPLFLGSLNRMLLVQVPVTVASRTLGVTAVAGITLATNITLFTQRVDDVVTQTLYPAICAVKDRSELLFESFWKSNRLALLWATPLGVGAALFAGDFVDHVIGDEWDFAVPLLAVFGLTAVLNQIGFNWTAFFRALGDTRPIAVESVVMLAAVLGIAVPLLATEGLTAFGVGLGIATLAGVAVRILYLRRIFPALAMLRHIVRGLGPTVPAALAVLGVRALETGSRTPVEAAGEAALFTALVVVATALSERRLLRESLGYLRRRPLAGVSA
jgi:O-antigen/teichoic acid export membrane protein